MRAATAAVVVAALAGGAVAVGCGDPRWHQVSPPPGAVYRYDPPIERYAPDDAGLWLVTARDATPDGRRRLARVLDDPDDVAGDGFVAWLTDDRAAWLREHPAVAAVTPLQPGARVGGLGDGAVAIAVRIELAAAASAAQRDGVVTWLAARGVTAIPAGAHTLDATVPPALARELATLGPVRWIERRRGPGGVRTPPATASP